MGEQTIHSRHAKSVTTLTRVIVLCIDYDKFFEAVDRAVRWSATHFGLMRTARILLSIEKADFRKTLSNWSPNLQQSPKRTSRKYLLEIAESGNYISLENSEVFSDVIVDLVILKGSAKVRIVEKLLGTSFLALDDGVRMPKTVKKVYKEVEIPPMQLFVKTDAIAILDSMQNDQNRTGTVLSWQIVAGDTGCLAFVHSHNKF
ncbi:hypothetical protein HDU83_003262 [Entophlyctis luteolus]|nr:hypothetical protein HDU83_003262 [Entophlyctis luteolus]